MTIYQRMMDSWERAKRVEYIAPDVLKPGLRYVKRLYAWRMVTVTIAEIRGTVRREFRATTDVDNWSYWFCTSDVRVAHMWALYTYGREARIAVEVRR